ncbi:MAG: hypothetical protein CSA74_10105 [Rhodobacterales bacterium]|nr:MAG: hypothetical protein CSA74_10105 [Rhodobacterales bacterium]
MRLVCPNCGAQYEVDDRVIPEGGRDVQCSSCGDAWYQMPAQAEGGEGGEDEPPLADTGIGPDDVWPEDEIEEFDSDTEEPEDEPEEFGDEPEEFGEEPQEFGEEPQEAAAEDPGDEPEPDPESDLSPNISPQPGIDENLRAILQEEAEAAEAAAAAYVAEHEQEQEPEESEEGPVPDTPPRRPLDEDLRTILQEEATREMEARAAESTALISRPTTIPDGGRAPDAPDDDAEPTITDAATFAATAKAARRDLFPDIEEINSTLDSHGPYGGDETEDMPRPRGGFRRGFLMTLFIAGLALALYLLAPPLARAVPALEPALSVYVSGVNFARAALETLIGSVTAAIENSQ